MYSVPTNLPEIYLRANESRKKKAVVEYTNEKSSNKARVHREVRLNPTKKGCNSRNEHATIIWSI